MSNLVEIAKDLEYVPDEQLIELANGSDPRFPPFVVISEIKRRTDMRSRASEPMPKTTVAQEMVQEFAMPSRQGLEGMSQDATGILPPTVYNRDMPSSNMADGGLVGYATGDETKYRGKINQLVGAKLGPTNPKTLDESMSDLQRFRKSQQIGRLINDPNNPLNKIFRYVPDPQQISNYLLGRRDNFTPDVRRATDKPMDKKQEGGLTGYQTGNQTALGNTFLYTPTIEGNVPISEQGLYRLLEERGITSEEERQEISNILSSGLARFSQPRDIQIAGVLKRSDDFIAEPFRGINSPFGRMADRRSFAAEILEGVSPGPQMPEGYVPPVDTSSDGNKKKDIDIKDGDNPNKDTDEKPTGLASANPQLELPEPPKPPTAAERQQELNANVLMTLGSAIGSSSTPQEIFKNLSGLPQQLMAIKSRQKQEDKDYRADLRANIKDKANYDIALKKLDVSITAARNSKNSDLVKYLGELKDLFTESSSESERTKLMEEINAVSSSIFSALVGKSPNSNDTDALNNALKIGTKS